MAGLMLQRARRRLGRWSLTIWFLPLLMSVGGLALFLVTTWLDARFVGGTATAGDLPGLLVSVGSARSAQTLLSGVAIGWATVLGVVFSFTLVSVQVTSTQYSAQMLTEFEKDRLNQLTLGSWTATVVYALLVLKTVRVEPPFVPVIGANLATAWAVLDLLLLVGFIGNIVSFARPHHFVASTVRDAVRNLDAQLLLRRGSWLRPLGEPAPEPESRFYRRWEIAAGTDGIVTGLELDGALEVLGRLMRDKARGRAGGRQWRLVLEKRLGDFVFRGEPVATIEAPLDEREVRRVARWLQQGLAVARERRPEGDPEYSLILLAETGLRAAASNEVELQIRCLDGLFSILRELARTRTGGALPRRGRGHRPARRARAGRSAGRHLHRAGAHRRGRGRPANPLRPRAPAEPEPSVSPADRARGPGGLRGPGPRAPPPGLRPAARRGAHAREPRAARGRARGAARGLPRRGLPGPARGARGRARGARAGAAPGAAGAGRAGARPARAPPMRPGVGRRPDGDAAQKRPQSPP